LSNRENSNCSQSQHLMSAFSCLATAGYLRFTTMAVDYRQADSTKPLRPCFRWTGEKAIRSFWTSTLTHLSKTGATTHLPVKTIGTVKQHLRKSITCRPKQDLPPSCSAKDTYTQIANPSQLPTGTYLPTPKEKQVSSDRFTRKEKSHKAAANRSQTLEREEKLVHSS